MIEGKEGLPRHGKHGLWLRWSVARLIEVVLVALLLVVWSNSTHYPDPWAGFTDSTGAALFYAMFFEIACGYAPATLLLTVVLGRHRKLMLLLAHLLLFSALFLLTFLLLDLAPDLALVTYAIGLASTTVATSVAFLLWNPAR